MSCEKTSAAASGMSTLLGENNVKCSQCRNRFAALVLALFLGLALNPVSQLGAQEHRTGLPPDLQTLIHEALKANPEVKQMASLAGAAKETIKPAGALEDPTVSFGMTNIPTDTWALNQDPMTQKMLELSQKFPFPGKRRLRSEVAAEQAKSEDLAYRDKANEVRAKVVMDYWNLALAYAGFDIVQKNKQFWEQVVQVTETRYKVGQGMQPDVLQAQVELGNYLDRLYQWKQRQESIQADLNALRSKPPQVPIGRPQPLTPRPFTLTLDNLLSQAEARPQLQALKALVAKQEKAVDLAKKEYFPDATVSLGYAFRETLGPPVNLKQADMFAGTVMFNLPIWQGSKIKPKIREEQERQAAAQSAVQNTWNQVAAAIKDRYAKLMRLAQQITLYNQGIIPQARQAAEASLMSYQVGSLGFERLYQNQINAFNAELTMQEYLKDFEENWAELEWLVGVELPRTPGGKK
jgi:cobalt-zinc-cadmium efflux system outer membrane protein